jgi:anhydro-N-acetylmuramic acid kinase
VRIIGLMSGTSMDGIDAALVDVEPPGPAAALLRDGDWRLVAFRTFPYPRSSREEIHDLVSGGDLASLTRLNVRLGEWFAEAALEACREAGVDPKSVDLIGSHGQTVWHEPPREGGRGATLQLACPATIAERTGMAVVSDFRSRDMAAGGEGAPLVPWVDRLLYSADRPRVLQNIGGMANLTFLPPVDSGAPVVAFDTGPGNALIDAAVELATGGERAYDEGGAWARSGAVDQARLTALLEHPYFDRPPPKSTGRETFGRGYVRALVDEAGPAGQREWADLIATLTAFTARSIAEAIARWTPAARDTEVIVTGGGARNPMLMEMLAAELAPAAVRGDGSGALRPEAREAVAFALLAWAHVHGLPANLPEVTGAAGPRVLGSYTPGRPPADPATHPFTTGAP